MEKLYLKKIDIDDKERVLDYVQELVMCGSKRDGLWYEDSESFEVMLENLQRHEHTPFTDYEQTDTPCIQYLLMRDIDKKMVGAVSIRPYLTKRLDDTFGGNVGYSIRPSERRKGYATIGLKLAVDICKSINPTASVMVCCYKDNIGSRKTILKNGGRLVEERDGVIPHHKYLID